LQLIIYERLNIKKKELSQEIDELWTGIMQSVTQPRSSANNLAQFQAALAPKAHIFANLS
jgi:hypothetical protein